VGDRVDAKVTSVDKATRKLGLTIKGLEIDEEKKAMQNYGSADSGATLGDILGAALSAKEATDETPDAEPEAEPETEAAAEEADDEAKKDG
jgi:small subunit ribosomal protein S1